MNVFLTIWTQPRIFILPIFHHATEMLKLHLNSSSEILTRGHQIFSRHPLTYEMKFFSMILNFN